MKTTKYFISWRDEEVSNGEDLSSFLLQESDDTTLNFSASFNQSGLRRYVTSTCKIAVQPHDCNVDKPNIRSNQDCTVKIKTTCAQMFTECAISILMAPIAVKTTCGSLYGHEFYIFVDGKSERDGDASQPSVKGSKPPYSKEEYAKYEKCLPSVRTIADYKHL